MGDGSAETESGIALSNISTFILIFHSKCSPNKRETATATGTRYLSVACKIFQGFLRFVFFIYIYGNF